MAGHTNPKETADGRPAVPFPDRASKPDPLLAALARYLARIAAERDHAAAKENAAAPQDKP
jgi:hypothetical protein